MTPHIDFVLDRYIPEPNSGCWLWTVACNNYGYGSFRRRETVGGKLRNYLAHRLTYQHFRGPIPTGLQVLHQCDVPSCINPDHLFLGTQAHNMADMAAKGRSMRGARNVNTKLTEAQVRAIRADRRKLREIAADYGTTLQNIWYVKNGDTWKHVSGIV